MLELHQRENCPYCVRVRRYLERHHLRYVSIPVPKLGSERASTTALPGTTSPEVPVLVDGATVVQGSDSIIEYLSRRIEGQPFADPSYGLTRWLPGADYAATLEATKAALGTEGFGVLTEIDVQATMRKKLDLDFPNYVILGACNPPLAHQALTAEPGLGLLLPCNVVVAQDPDGVVVVSAVDPVSLFSIAENRELKPVAREVRRKLARALAAIQVTIEARSEVPAKPPHAVAG